MGRAAGPARSAAPASRRCEHQKTVDPIWPTARGLCLAALPPVAQLERGADLPPSAPLIGVAGRSIRALRESFMAVTRVLVERLAGRHHTAVRQGRGRRGSLRPALPRCQARPGVVVRGPRSCRFRFRISPHEETGQPRTWAFARVKAAVIERRQGRILPLIRQPLRLRIAARGRHLARHVATTRWRPGLRQGRGEMAMINVRESPAAVMPTIEATRATTIVAPQKADGIGRPDRLEVV